MHVDTVVPALKAGKAVLCEKPFAMNARQAQIMVDAAKVSGSFILEAFHYQFHDAFLAFKRRIERGDIGTVFAFEGAFNVVITEKPGELRFNRALGGGALMDLGCYPLHAARTLFGEPSHISAKAEMYKGIDRNLWASMICGDVDVQIECSMDDVYRHNPRVMIMAHGEQGSLAFKNFVSPQNGHDLIHITPSSMSHHTLKDSPTSYRAQLDYFIKALQNPTSAAPVSSADFVAQMQAIDTIYTAAKLSN